MSASTGVGHWWRWLAWIDWIRIDIVPGRFRTPFIRDRSVTRYPTRRGACHLRKACRPVPCPSFRESRLEVLATSHADQARLLADFHQRKGPTREKSSW